MSDQNQETCREAVRQRRREVEILSRIVEGHTSKQVADLLFISRRTVDFHLENIFEKLHVNNRLQALHQATRLGLLTRAA